MNVLVTGGAGFIGSHAILRLMEDGHTVTSIDDFSRGNRGAIAALRAVGPFEFVEGDVGDRALMATLMRDRGIDLVMHFAAKAYVGESMDIPLTYYATNTSASIALLQAMDDAGVERIVFSSTCASYGEPPADRVPIREDCPQRPINPYGYSKWFVERVLFDHGRAKREAGRPFGFACLRYFNVAGNDQKSRLGEDHRPETHLIPICLEAALGHRKSITVFGTDYATPDGTCIRDYVHVSDLIDAHITVMSALGPGDERTYNIGIGDGSSVREVIEATRDVTGRAFEVIEGPRRAGDPPMLYADSSKIRDELGWVAKHTDLRGIIDDAWRWRQVHPHGYGEQ
ncbi:MAG: UDP-glucose 4-epimerase GalE [Phycisphaerales bacterium]|nr:UDP-glucose 4-epimerase GalE [Phycisphaerales bacterium]